MRRQAHSAYCTCSSRNSTAHTTNAYRCSGKQEFSTPVGACFLSLPCASFHVVHSKCCTWHALVCASLAKKAFQILAFPFVNGVMFLLAASFPGPAMPDEEHSQRDDFQFLSKLGSGSFGTVYKVSFFLASRNDLSLLLMLDLLLVLPSCRFCEKRINRTM